MVYENLAEMFESQCKKMGDKRLFIFYDNRLRIKSSLSAIELLERSRKVAKLIAGLSHEKAINIHGQVVFLSFASVSDFIVTFWAVVISGGIPSPVPVRIIKDEKYLNKALLRSRAVLLIQDRKFQGDNSDSRSIIFSELCKSKISGKDYTVSSQKNNDIALLQHSSWSTSEPKPLELTNRNVLHNLERITRTFSISDSDVGASWLPHYHDMGLIGHILVPLYSEIENHFLSPVEFSIRPISWLKLITKTRATISGAPNFAYQFCYEYMRKNRNVKDELDLTSWRVAYSGSECISLKTLKLFSSAVDDTGFSDENYYPCYGLAESTLMVSCRKGLRVCQLGRGKKKTHVSVGVACPNEITIVRDDKSVCSEREVGQISIHSPSVTEFSGQEVVNTGDVGFISDGELYVIGRQVNVVKYHGEKVYLDEVELLLDQDLSEHGVRRCLVIQVDYRKYQYAILIESSTRGLVNLDCEVKRKISHVISRYLGDSRYKTVSVARGELYLTSSGKPDRRKNKKLIIDLTKVNA